VTRVSAMEDCFCAAASFAHDVDAGDRSAVDLIEAQADEFRDAQARGEGQVEHRPIPDPAGLVQIGRDPVFEETEERVDGGMAGVAGACRVAAHLLDMLEEGE
jgi:hypothetical protein